MTLREFLFPVLTINARQALRLRMQSQTIQRQHDVIETLRERLRRMNADVDLLACCIPQEHRQDALALVRDLHRIDALDEVEVQ